MKHFKEKYLLNWANQNYPLAITLLLNIITGLYIIFSFPFYFSDDLMIYTKVVEDGLSFITSGINQNFFFLTRPVSFLSFILDYKLWGTNPFFCKIDTLILHILFIISTYYFMLKIFQIYKINYNKTVLTISLVFITLHPDAVIWLYWISNRTELLMVLFYVLSILFFVYYIEKRSSIFLLLSFLTFIFSLLSKQQSAHLPFLYFLFIWLNRKNEKPWLDRWIVGVIAAEIISVIIFSYLNYSLYERGHLIVFQNLWKKPLSFPGIILFVVLPLKASEIYFFFLGHKWLAVILLILITVLIIGFCSKKNKLANLWQIVLFLLIIMYPRIFAVGSERINSIQILWFGVGMILIFSKMIKYKRLVITILLLFLALNFFASNTRLEKTKEYYDYTGDIVNKLSIFSKGEYYNYFIVAGEYTSLLNYNYNYFVKNKLSGIGFSCSPIITSRDLGYFNEECSINYLSVKRNNNLIELFVHNESFGLGYDFADPDFSKFKITNEIKQENSRGIKAVTITLPSNVAGKKLIYFTGKEWREIND